jgi:hypothetical protein
MASLSPHLLKLFHGLFSLTQHKNEIMSTDLTLPQNTSPNGNFEVKLDVILQHS